MRINLFLDQKPEKIEAVRTIILAHRNNLEVDGEVADGRHLFSFTTEDLTTINNSLIYFLSTESISRLEYLKEDCLANKKFYKAAASSNPQVSYVEIGDGTMYYFYNLKDNRFWVFTYGRYRTTFCPSEHLNWASLDQAPIGVMGLWRNREKVIQGTLEQDGPGTSAG